MIRWVRTATPREGKLRAAKVWGEALAAAANRITGHTTDFCIERGGANRFAWTVDFQDAATMEREIELVTADPSFMKQIEVFGDLFFGEEPVTTVWEMAG